MATWNQITQTGGLWWELWGGSITNHEVFAFSSIGTYGTGAQISDVTVFSGANFAGQNAPAYKMLLSAVNESMVPSAGQIIGNFESNGV